MKAPAEITKSARSIATRTFHVLLLETNVREAKTLLPLAEQLAIDRKGKITILSVLLVPEGEQMSVVAKKASRLREEIKSYMEVAPKPTRIKTLVRTEQDIWDGIRICGANATNQRGSSNCSYPASVFLYDPLCYILSVFNSPPSCQDLLQIDSVLLCSGCIPIDIYGLS